MILSIQQVSKQYANHVALHDIDLAIPRGKIVGLLGPNGAGKTSLIRIINQITAPDTGEVFFDGERLAEKHLNDIGYLPEERGLYKKMKVGEQLLYLAQLKGMSKSAALERLKEWFIRLDIKDWWEKPVNDLSKGMQQKAQFIATVVHEPKLLILDEPFSGFDPINAQLLTNEILALRDRGTSILFSTHRMESVEELCDEIVLIDRAKVVLSGNKEEVRSRFKENKFAVKYTGVLPAEMPGIDIVQLDKGSAVLQFAYSPNQAIIELIKHIEIQSFHELIPSFNDIFIRVVNEKI